MAKSRRARAKPVDAEAAKAKLELEAGKNVASEEVDAEAQAKADAKAKAETEKKAALDANLKVLAGLEGKISAIANKLTDSRELKGAASLQRSRWAEYGALIMKARDVNPSHKVFNAWLKSHDLEIGDRNTRTAAMWLSGMPQSLMDAIPGDGQRTLSNPKSVRKWWKSEVREACEVAISLGVEASKNDTTEDMVASFDDAIEDSDGAVQDTYRAAKAFIEVNHSETIATEFAGYKPAATRKGFVDMTVEEAAEFILTTILRHPDPAGVVELIQEKLEKALADAEKASSDDTEADEDYDEDDEAELDDSEEFEYEDDGEDEAAA